MCVCVRVCVRGRNHGNYLEEYVLPNHCWQILTMLCKIVPMRRGDGFPQDVQVRRGNLLRLTTPTTPMAGLPVSCAIVCCRP